MEHGNKTMAYKDSALVKSTYWYEFKRDWKTDLGRRYSRKHKKVHNFILTDRKVKLRKTADTLNISEVSVYTILHENLGLRKLCSKWIGHLQDFSNLKPGFTTTFLNQIGRQLSEEWVKAVQSVQNDNSRILRSARYNIHLLPWKRTNHQ